MPHPPPQDPGSPVGDPTTVEERRALPRIRTRPATPEPRSAADLAPLSVSTEIQHIDVRRDLRAGRPDGSASA
jgi:hypothetical protein